MIKSEHKNTRILKNEHKNTQLLCKNTWRRLMHTYWFYFHFFQQIFVNYMFIHPCNDLNKKNCFGKLHKGLKGFLLQLYCLKRLTSQSKYRKWITQFETITKCFISEVSPNDNISDNYV